PPSEFLSNRPINHWTEDKDNNKWEYLEFFMTQLTILLNKFQKTQNCPQDSRLLSDIAKKGNTQDTQTGKETQSTTNKQKLQYQQLNIRIRNLTEAYLLHKQPVQFILLEKYCLQRNQLRQQYQEQK
ncbi:4921_t:CDS:2, partial [Entrophospora sp. SA101]